MNTESSEDDNSKEKKVGELHSRRFTLKGEKSLDLERGKINLALLLPAKKKLTMYLPPHQTASANKIGLDHLPSWKLACSNKRSTALSCRKWSSLLDPIRLGGDQRVDPISEKKPVISGDSPISLI